MSDTNQTSDFKVGDKVRLSQMVDDQFNKGGTVTKVHHHENNRVSYDVDFPDYQYLGDRFSYDELQPFITVVEN